MAKLRDPWRSPATTPTATTGPARAKTKLQASRRVGPYSCTQCSPPTSWDTYRKLSYHRENQHRLTFEFEANGQTVVAVRDAADRKLSCARCSGRWSDLNSFKKHVREVCPPPAPAPAARRKEATDRRLATRRPPSPPPPSTSSPLSSLPSSPPPPFAFGFQPSSSARSSTAEAGVFVGQAAPLGDECDRRTSPPAKTTATPTAGGRPRSANVKGAFVFPPLVTPAARRSLGPPATGSRIAAALDQRAQAPAETDGAPTSARRRRKQRVHSLDSVWDPVERRAGLSLREEFERLGGAGGGSEDQGGPSSEDRPADEPSSPWWDVRAWRAR